MSTEPFESDVPTRPRDRREHGGASMRPNDDELALRTERERVEAGLQPYDSEDVPPAADAAVPYDAAGDEVSAEIAGIGARQEDEGETVPLSEDHPFPPTRYDES
ncbi:MAG TPA: hypothetical protein VH502_10005 [Actinoplanes sp.]|jgi:hypothetical protein